MPKSNKKQVISDNKKPPGRPRVDAVLIGVRVPPDMLEALDKYAAGHTRPTAIRLLMRLGLVKEGLLPKR